MRESVIKHVYHPSDFSRESEVAYDHALRIALQGGLPLTIMHVNTVPVDRSRFPSAGAKLKCWQVTPPNGHASENINSGFIVKKIQLTNRDPVQGIVRHLEEKPAGLIVLANSGQDNRPRWVNKTVSEPIARHSRTMSLFLPHRARGFVDRRTGNVTLRRVLIAVDRKPDPQRAINTAVELTDLLECRAVTFTKIYVGDENNMPDPQLPGDPRWSWVRAVRKGDVVNEILNVATNMLADLIVLTTQGHDGFLDALRGSTTERILRAANCPVLAVPTQLRME